MAARTGGGLALAVLALLAFAGAGSGGSTDDGTDGGLPAGTKGTSVRARDHSAAAVEHRLEAGGLKVTRLEDDSSDNCAAHSYGEVREHFREHRCTALHRALFDVRDDEDHAVVAVAWVDMPDEVQARQYQRLVDRHGTGNVTELTEDGSTAVRWTGRRYASVRDGVTVVNVQAEPVGRDAGSARLAERAGTTAIG